MILGDTEDPSRAACVVLDVEGKGGMRLCIIHMLAHIW